MDWAAGPLGPVEEWSDSLRTAVRAVMPAQVPILLMWGPELTQIYNDANRLFMGNKHPAAMGLPAAQTWQEMWPEVGPLVWSVARGGEPISRVDQMFLIDRHGYPEESYWTFSYSPWPDSTGEAAGVAAVAQETTSQVLQHRRLATLHDLAVSGLTTTHVAETAQRVVDVLQGNRTALPFAAVYLVGPGGRLGWQAGYGADPNSYWAVPDIAVDSDHPYARALTDSEMRQVATSTGARALLPGPTGPARPTCVTVLPLRASDAGTYGVFAFATTPYRPHDETQRQFLRLVIEHVGAAMNRTLSGVQATERAERSARLEAAKSRFYENASHEFRNPLTVLRLAVGVLKPHLASEAEPNLRGISRAVDDLDQLVDALLAFDRLPSLPPDHGGDRADLADVTRDVVNMFAAVASRAGLDLITEISPVGYAQVDEEAWRRIVANLVSNALKYTVKGSITIRLAVAEGTVRLEVADTGVGIADADRAEIFKRFHRGESGLANLPRGLGLGLPLVQDLVHAHGGSVLVDSRVREGSTFTVRLPLRGLTVPGDQPAAGSEKASTEATTESPALVFGLPAPNHTVTHTPAVTSPSPPRGRLILVEDDVDVRAQLITLLTRDGWHVDATAHVAGALAATDPPDLVLTDITLPGPSGLDLVRLLRTQPGWDRLPIVLLTARAGEDAVVEGIAAGADDYIVKPFHARELLARLTVHHEMAKRRDRARLDAESRALGLETALQTNRRIGLALGIIMGHYRVTDTGAFEMLRRVSNDTNRRLAEVAEDVILTGSLETASQPASDHRATGPRTEPT